MVYKRVSRYYNGPVSTTRQMRNILPDILKDLGRSYKDRPDLILAAWPGIIGAAFAKMTQALSFQEGILTVKVNNSTLYSLLNQNDKPRIIQKLREQFPKTVIKTIIFRMG